MDGLPSRYTVRLTNSNAVEWTRFDEVRQRIRTAWGMIKLAWLALRSDSAMFASVLLNSVREEGDGLIARVTMKSGQAIQIIPDRDGK